MKVADLLFALNELRAGRISVDELIAACSAWSNEPTRPLADFLKPGAAPPPAPLAEPASGVLDSFASRRPTASRRAAPAGSGGINRNLVLIAAGIGLVVLVVMAVGLGYLGQSNARLEADNEKLRAAIAHPEAVNGELAAAHRPAEQPREPRASAKPDPVRETTTATTTSGVPAKTAEPMKSIRALEEDLEKLQKSAGPNDPRTVRAALALAHALWVTGPADRAIEVCERVRDELPDNDPLFPEARLQLALAYRAAGKWDRAKPLFLDHLVFARKENKDRQVGEALAWMGECLLRLDDPAGAEPLVRECVDLSTQYAADWSAFAAKSLLGEVLLAQKKPEQAEPLMTQGYDGLKARKDSIPWDRQDALPIAAGRLVKLYETTGDQIKAAEWKKVEEQVREKK